MTGPKLLFENEFETRPEMCSTHEEIEWQNREFDKAALDVHSPWLPPPPVADAEANETRGVTPLLTQIGGAHYKKLKIQPVEYVHANGIGYFEGTAIKYLTRWKDKGGIEDLRKAIHFIELLIQLEQK